MMVGCAPRRFHRYHVLGGDEWMSDFECNTLLNKGMHPYLTLPLRRMLVTLTRSLLLVVAVAAWSGSVHAEDDSPPQPSRPPGRPSGVYKDRITPHWFASDSRFWYRNDLKGGAREFVLVDAEKGTRAPAFDHTKLAAALSKAAGREYRADRLPFDSISFTDDGKSVRFVVVGKTWTCNLGTYECTAGPEGKGEAAE